VLAYKLFKENYDFIINDLAHVVPWPSAPILSKKIVFFRHLHARTLPGQVNPLLAYVLSNIEKTYHIIYRKSIFVTESKTSKYDLINLGISERRIFLIPPGVDKGLFKPTKKTDYPSIIYFRGIKKYKRPQEALLLFKEIIKEIPNVKLYVVSTGPEINNLLQLTKELNLENYVTFTGRLSEKELAELCASSWLNVYTSVAEGWGYSVLEASASGTPTVAYDVPGISDAIEDGLNGIKTKSREGLVEAAIRILKDPEQWWKSSLMVAEKYSWERTTELWKCLPVA